MGTILTPEEFKRIAGANKPSLNEQSAEASSKIFDFKPNSIISKKDFDESLARFYGTSGLTSMPNIPDPVGTLRKMEEEKLNKFINTLPDELDEDDKNTLINYKQLGKSDEYIENAKKILLGQHKDQESTTGGKTVDALTTIAGATATGAAIGSVVPIAGITTGVGAAIGLTGGVGKAIYDLANGKARYYFTADGEIHPYKAGEALPP